VPLRIGFVNETDDAAQKLELLLLEKQHPMANRRRSPWAEMGTPQASDGGIIRPNKGPMGRLCGTSVLASRARRQLWTRST
jgi:hypothetical protein